MKVEGSAETLGLLGRNIEHHLYDFIQSNIFIS